MRDLKLRFIATFQSFNYYDDMKKATEMEISLLSCWSCLSVKYWICHRDTAIDVLWFYFLFHIYLRSTFIVRLTCVHNTDTHAHTHTPLQMYTNDEHLFDVSFSRISGENQESRIRALTHTYTQKKKVREKSPHQMCFEEKKNNGKAERWILVTKIRHN